MSADVQEPTAGNRTPALHPRVVLAVASRLARAARYDEAVRELAALDGDDSTDPAVLDLLARVHAQRGRLDDADACWARAQQLDPDAPGVREGRAYVAQRRSHEIDPRPGRRRTVLVVAGVVGAVVLAGLGGALIGRSTVPPPSGESEVAELRDLQRDMNSRLPELDSGRADSAATALDELSEALDGGLVTVDRRPDRLVLTFPGLFESGTRFTDDARTMLRDLGARLTGAGTALRFVVVGHTADVTGTRGGEEDREIGLQRAAGAALELAASSGRPLADFPVTSDGMPVRADVDPIGNRTVSVIVQSA